MTISELYRSVSQLGFEESLEDDNRFFYAANRALLEINALRPRVSFHILHHAPLPNQIGDAGFSPIRKESELFFEAEDVKSYYFEASGNSGMLYIERLSPASGEWEKTDIVAIGGMGFTPYRGFIKADGEFTSGRIRLHFTGEYLYYVKNVAMYSALLSADTADIPAFAPYTRYDISSLAPDFLALHAPPILEDEGFAFLTDGYSVENERVLLLPRDTAGLYKILYHKLPTRLENTGEAADDMTEIELDEDLASLLPILIAAYVWADDEPEKAQYYLSIYGERIAGVQARALHAAPVRIKSVNGW